MLRLLSVYEAPESNSILWNLLEERDPVANINHREMPSYVEHEKFVASMPYMAWMLVMLGATPIGTAYLTKRREIGIQIANGFQSRGYGFAAVEMLMQRFPGDFLANISPGNSKSTAMFQKLGFSLQQVTYGRRA